PGTGLRGRKRDSGAYRGGSRRCPGPDAGSGVVIRQAERRWRSRRGDLFPEAPALAWPTLTEDGAELTANQWGNLTHMPRSGLSVPRAFPPGDFIREELEARGWTQRDLAEIIGRPVQTVSAIVNQGNSAVPIRGFSMAFWHARGNRLRSSRSGQST